MLLVAGFLCNQTEETSVVAYSTCKCCSRSENLTCSFGQSKIIEFGSSSSFETSQRTILNVLCTKYLPDAAFNETRESLQVGTIRMARTMMLNENFGLEKVGSSYDHEGYLLSTNQRSNVMAKCRTSR